MQKVKVHAAFYNEEEKGKDKKESMTEILSVGNVLLWMNKEFIPSILENKNQEEDVRWLTLSIFDATIFFFGMPKFLLNISLSSLTISATWLL